MSHVSGVFADPRAGRLRVTLSGTFQQGTRRDAGFPSGSSNVLVAALVNGAATPAIDRYAPDTTREFDYPGGNAAWTISTFTVANVFGGGTSSYGFADLKVVIDFWKS